MSTSEQESNNSGTNSQEPQGTEAMPRESPATPTTSASCLSCQELTSTVKYVQAEFENYKKRVERDKQLFQKTATRDLIESFLPVVDSFEIALHTSNSDPAIKGFELVYAQLIDILSAQGVTPIDSLGKPFDPRYNEALLQETNDQPRGTVIEVLQKGWMISDQVLRTAKVKIAQ